MKSENEIKAMPLEDLQKFVVDLRQIPTGDKGYANAKAMITFCTELKKWKEPALIEVKNTADFDLPVDGKTIPKESTGKVYKWQADALSRWLEVVDAAKVALLILALLLGCSFPAMAQNNPYATGGPSTYNVQAINGYVGYTNLTFATNTANSILGTNFLLTPVYTTNVIVLPNWTFTSGIWTNIPTTNSIITTNIPGIVSAVNSDTLDIFWGYQLMGSSVVAPGQLQLDYSADLINWQTNAFTSQLASSNTWFVSTNIQLTLFAPGYIRFNYIGYPTNTAALAMTNVVLEVGKKPNRTGP